MNTTLQKMSRRTEPYILGAIIALSLLIQARSGQFFTGNNLVDLARSMTVPGLFAVGAMIVIVSGGIDVSFPAIASLSMYITTKILLAADYSGPVILAYIIGGVLGLLMGLFNGVLIGYFRFPTLVVTLGTSSLFIGIMQGVLAARELPVPPAMFDHGTAKLFSAYNTQLGLSSDMPVQILLLVAVLAVTAFLLRSTMLGRGIYAIGGDEVSAKRAGFNVFGTKMFIYGYVGVIAGIAGIARACMMRNAHPTNLQGIEMIIIAAVVLGGTRVTGGVGTLTGTMFGMALMTIMSNSLILLGIPTYWQKVFTGAIIIIGTGVSARQAMAKRAKPRKASPSPSKAPQSQEASK
ncbi:MAG: ABC transporter permease [Spirochaetales bacterium]|nr:ABC transporter permease [Spirochaetales bacterium]